MLAAGRLNWAAYVPCPTICDSMLRVPSCEGTPVFAHCAPQFHWEVFPVSKPPVNAGLLVGAGGGETGVGAVVAVVVVVGGVGVTLGGAGLGGAGLGGAGFGGTGFGGAGVAGAVVVVVVVGAGAVVTVGATVVVVGTVSTE